MKWRSKNKEKHAEYQKQWRAKNAQQIAAYREENRSEIRSYFKHHYKKNRSKYIDKYWKRRALKAKASVNLRQIRDWMDRIKSKKTFTCYHCGETKPIEFLHFDHIVPLTEGGAHSIENLCASCSKCNWSKGSKLLKDWYKAGQLILGL